MMTDAVLEVKHLSVDYGSASGAVHAVDDVSFTLRRGQILGLAGESGSGKSTLAYAIARLLRPPALVTQGEVCSIRAPTPRARPRMRPGLRWMCWNLTPARAARLSLAQAVDCLSKRDECAQPGA